MLDQPNFLFLTRTGVALIKMNGPPETLSHSEGERLLDMFLGVLSQLADLVDVNDTAFQPVPGHGPCPLLWGLPFFHQNATMSLVSSHDGLSLDIPEPARVLQVLVGFSRMYTFTISGQATSTNLPPGGLTVIASNLLITPLDGRHPFLCRIQLRVHVRLSPHGYKFVTINQVILNDEVV